MQLMERRYFKNPCEDYKSGSTASFTCDKTVKQLISTYVDSILRNSPPENITDKRGDLYVGKAGIAYMFWKLDRCPKTKDMYQSMEYAVEYISAAKESAQQNKKHSAERHAFLCGNAGIYAVSAAISQTLNKTQDLALDLSSFKTGIAACKEHIHTKYGCDEFLVGRAGYLSGCYWLNDIVLERKIKDRDLISICQIVMASGREYSRLNKSPMPLMYDYHGTEYIGAAHGVCAVLHMLLESPWFRTAPISASQTDLHDIKMSIDYILELQDKEGNFPIGLEDLRTGRDKRLVHWCHGAPGIVYMLAKAYLVFKEQKYLNAVRRAGELVWRRGILRKGPGICHGVAGNGYVFLLLYRLTQEVKYLYRANKFMEMLTNAEFQEHARIPDRPHSLYEGVAGTVCFLIDLLEPDHAHFPFMDVFH